ncbi:adenylate/guanylate cyclase domain-containing protein, partial [Nostoc sp. NIES-2111]
MPATRKLAVILAVDIVGFSRLASQDEERILARIRALKGDLIEPAVAAHHGRVVKGLGDGVLVEFRSSVDAVRCALEIQDSMLERNLGLPEEKWIVLRVGIHVGDVVEEADGDLMGDAVNIAVRLEGLCAPGSIVVSEDLYRQIKGKLNGTFSELGPQALKNIPEPIRAFGLRPGSAKESGTLSAPKLPEKPSIAVLPFQNLSGDPEQEYFADGIVEDVITGLSR